MIDLECPLPEIVLDGLSGPESVLAHTAKVDSDRWQDGIRGRGLPAPEGKLASGGWIRLSRKEVFDLGGQAPSKSAVFQLLYHSLAWGLGPKAPRMHARLDGLARDPGMARDLLLHAWEEIRAGESPSSVYRVLVSQRGFARIPWFGPAFATKFMYFAQGSAVTPRCLILDSRVAGKLRVTAWPDARLDGWVARDYEAYCELLQRWAAEATSLGSAVIPVRADAIEYELFKPEPEDEVSR